MQNFRTEIAIPMSKYKVSLQTPILCLGSCFSDLIGKKLLTHKFDVLHNPFGTLFNPIIIFDLLEIVLKKEKPTYFDTLYTQSNSLWKHFWLHSDFASLSKKDLMSKVNIVFKKVEQFFEHQEKKVLFITFGTSWVYSLQENQVIVANCHKHPSSLFEKKLLPIQVLETRFFQIMPFLKKHNLNIVLTVSPIRHTKEGLANNQVSKSILRVFCQQLSNQLDFIEYFPSYEILMDDLRDYRFYSEDLIHPNVLAENYIWTKFIETFFEEKTAKHIDRWQKMLKQLQHHPLHISPDYLLFLEKTKEKLYTFEEKINVKNEIEEIENKITAVKKVLDSN